MAKRSSRAGDPATNPRKRVKVVHETATSEEVHTSRQLKQLLTFDQDLQRARHGLQSFKGFLDVLNGQEHPDEDQVKLLTEYLESCTPKNDDPDTTYLPDIMETWSLGAHSNNDSIMSAVPVVLALLLKFVSQRFDLTKHGLGIGRTLLQRRQLDLIARNLVADKSKEFIISPTLRLLRELVCFDGGALAKPVFRARNHTFKSLGRNMQIKYLGEGIEDSKRPSARTNAIRFFLSALKFLHLEAKAEVLSQKEIGPALMKYLRDDPPLLIFEILDTLKKHVLKEEKLQGAIKARLFSSTNLFRLASLYGYQHDATEEGTHGSVEDVAHEFLLDICTSPSAGVLRSQSGFYPKDVDPDSVLLLDTRHGGGDEQGLEGIVWIDKFKDEVPVRNLALAEFIQTLRPWSSLKQSQLIVAIFKAAPELVAHYFINKKSFTFEPKLSTTWIGYAAFLFNAIQLPIPPAFGHKSGYAQVPPPTSIMLDNIIPLPLNQKVLGRCLVQKSDLAPFFAIRLLVIAMQKLQTALELHREAIASPKSLWTESSRRLVDEFCQRTPSMKEVIATYRGISEGDLLQREAASRLLRLYYEVIPQVALMAKFDVSPFLVIAIKRLDRLRDSPQDQALSLIELENLLAIAGYSPGMKWFSKAEGLTLSPFTALLKVLVAAPEGVSLGKLRETIGFVAAENQLLAPQQGYRGFMPLFESIQVLENGLNQEALDVIWGFLDNVASRCATTPIKYLEMMQSLAEEARPAEGSQLSSVVSPITLAMAEQLPFIVKTAAIEAQKLVARFLSMHLGYSKAAAEDDGILRILKKRMSACFTEKVARKQFKAENSVTLRSDVRSYGADSATAEGEAQISEPSDSNDVLSQDALTDILFVPLSLNKDNSALMKWSSKATDELIDEGYASAVVALLCSDHLSIRKEALTSILKIAVRVQESTYDEKEQIWLLLSELAESAKPEVEKGPLPTQIVAFAAHALDVLKNPLHCLYSKVNVFLTRGPVWGMDRLPLVHEILQEEPEVDDSYYASLSWLLSYLLDSLQTPEDMALFHKRRLFERLLSLASNPYMRQNMKTEILKIVYRATVIESGSTTLVTRFGIVSWLEAQRSSSSGSGHEYAVYAALLRRVWDTCDQERVGNWSRQGVKDSLLVEPQ
ncbi:Nucleolar pre-ribosomal-associated protein 1 [Pleurostoma richardsiae]|uniref:Nucleolar pre-ribosomal-associated protein 1 n=1 Tax=Pleurostoma richardsiae TaxID=41990 RepID=A0AA38RCN1_9PEZI|nr:Nucleolar pre-ribosomal-associated protein 1 [Pleurostoma richardsiae]